jgi:outer membrane lipoprotein-sorting protein
VALLGFLLGSGRAAQPADPDVGAMLRELSRAGAEIETLQARFVQEKHVAIVRDVLRCSGTFLLDRRIGVVWGVIEPEPARIVVRKDGVFADGKRVGDATGAAAGVGPGDSPLPILQGLNDIFAGISEQTTRDFEVALLADERLRLTPRSAALGAWLSALEIRLDARTRTPAHVHLEEPGGDSTDITFSDVVVNPELGVAAFAP